MLRSQLFDLRSDAVEVRILGMERGHTPLWVFLRFLDALSLCFDQSQRWQCREGSKLWGVQLSKNSGTTVLCEFLCPLTAPYMRHSCASNLFSRLVATKGNVQQQHIRASRPRRNYGFSRQRKCNLSHGREEGR